MGRCEIASIERPRVNDNARDATVPNGIAKPRYSGFRCTDSGLQYLVSIVTHDACNGQRTSVVIREVVWVDPSFVRPQVLRSYSYE